jgi:two-component system, OmpR family, sensor kinase
MPAERFSLRVKLVAAVLALVTVALTVMAVTTVTALRRYLTQRLDRQLAEVCGQVRTQLESGSDVVVVPESSGSVQVPSPFLLESLYPDGSLYRSDPWPLPATAPRLDQAALARFVAFTAGSTASTAGGAVRWRVRVLRYSGGYFVAAINMSDVDSEVARLARMTLVVGLGVFLGMAAIGMWLVRSSLRPLVEIERTAAAIAAGDLSRRVPERGTRTEVGRLGHAFNVMIGRIEYALGRALRSEERMRQFAADASHELRTPLTTIRGFAELHRQVAVHDPDGSARLVRRIEDEARRMGLLVEDLLLLARLDQRRPLARQPVDLTVLAADAVEDAHAVAPGRPVSLSLSGEGSLLVTGDEERLRQVLRNLVTNALTHTPPEASVAIRLSRTPQEAVLEVADTGPGLAPEQQQRVFERFYRADPSRSRREGGTGTGLGLAIVAAITAAHSGRVELDSAPGAGATFRLILPVAQPPPATGD